MAVLPTVDWEYTDTGVHEAKAGQGPITIHASENLGHTDRGVQMVRHQLRQMLTALETGEPVGGLASSLSTVASSAGNFLLDPADAQ